MNIKRLPTRAARMAAYAKRFAKEGGKVRVSYAPPASPEHRSPPARISLQELRRFIGM